MTSLILPILFKLDNIGSYSIALLVLHFLTCIAIALSYVDAVGSIWKKIPLTIVMPAYLATISYIMPKAIFTMTKFKKEDPDLD